MDFIKKTEELWRSYFLGDENGNYIKSDFFDADCVIIGTGRHEFYQNKDEFSQTLDDEIRERKNIRFQIKNLWCEPKQLRPDLILTYGEIFVFGESNDKNIRIHMDSRFSILYNLTENGWKIIHLHQSVPNPEQKNGEYYPKSLSEQLEREKRKAESLSLLAQKDGLTDLINYRTFQKLYKNHPLNNTWFFVADLDYFKNINDTYGHVEGNRILRETADILKSSVRSDDLVCRMGGDEFVLLCSGLQSLKNAENLLDRILANIAGLQLQGHVPVSLSIGATSVCEGESLDVVFRRADHALYEVKAKGRNGWRIC